MHGITIGILLAACADPIENPADQVPDAVNDEPRPEAAQTIEDVGENIENGLANVEAEGRDAKLAATIRGALDDEPELKDAQIEVEVDDGVVTLTGVIASFPDRLRATSIATAQPGVVRVKNELHLD